MMNRTSRLHVALSVIGNAVSAVLTGRDAHSTGEGDWIQRRRARSPRVSAASSCAAACVLAAASTASGQSADEASPTRGAAQPAQSVLLEEIIVTGYRVDASTSATGIVTAILDTPISISAITDEFLSDTASTQIMDAIGALTGVTGQSNSGETTTNFSVRGFAVTPQVDGFDTLSTAAGLGSSIGVERIEVVKGPSAVFNGNVPPGGTINIIYKKPSFTPENYVQTIAGSWNYKSGEIYSSGPLFSDKFAYLVNGFIKDSEGWVDWTGQEEKTIVLGATYKPVDAVSMTLSYRNANHDNRISTLPVSHEGYMESGAPWFVPLDAWVADNFGPDEPPQTITIPQFLPRGERYNVLGPQNHNEAELELAGAEVVVQVNDHIEIRDSFMYSAYEWDILAILQSGAKVLAPDGRSGLLSGFLAADIRGSGWENKLEAALNFDTGPISHAMLVGYRRSASEVDLLDLWIGPPAFNANGQNWDYHVDGPRMLHNEFNARLASNPNPDAHIANSGRIRTHAYYVAEQMSMFDERLHLLVGGRYTETTADKRRVSDTTPQIGVAVKPFSPDSVFADTSIFVNYSESFTPSGLVQPGTDQVVPPAQGVGKEIGVKTAWFGGAVTSTVSVFRDELDNIATPDYSNQGAGGLVEYHLGGKGRVEGAEAEVIWTPSEAVQLSANYTYLPTAKYLAYPGVPAQVGLRFPSTPKHAWNLNARYDFASGAYLGGWIHGQSETRGVIAADWHYDIRIPDLVQVDAFLGYTYKKLDARLNIKNVTDRDSYVMNNAFQPNPPRAYYLTLHYSL